jgi:hypothetical protein
MLTTAMVAYIDGSPPSATLGAGESTTLDLLELKSKPKSILPASTAESRRSAITTLLLQHEFLASTCPARFRLPCKRDGFFVSLAPGHHSPEHSRDLAGERDRI